MYGKLMIQTELEVLTGLHIGGSSVFSAIGAVDSPVVRDPYTHLPILPGSSLKGKLRSLLSRSLLGGRRCALEEDPPVVKRLFGCQQAPITLARLQFTDGFVTPQSVEKFRHVGLTEIKWENAIHRLTAVANPRQIERVVPGVRFDCRIAYTLEQEDEVEEDLGALAQAMRLLQLDYLGGYGTRGSGRVSFRQVRLAELGGLLDGGRLAALQALFKEVESYDLLSV